MPTIKRNDGVQFVTQPYRELPEAKSNGALKREIRAHAHAYGQQVRIFKLPHGQLEAVFSHDTGFLLGETIWQHFNQPENLIYCEVLPERQQALLVVVKAGTIYLDTKTSLANLADEFASLVTAENKYQIYTYGDVPLTIDKKATDKKADNKFILHKKYVESFTQLPEPLFPNLPAKEELQLQPLELALTSQYLRTPAYVPLTGVVLTIFAIMAGWHFYFATPTKKAIIQIQNKPNPYHRYYTALRTAAPLQQLQQLISLTALNQTLPGWKITAISYNSDNFKLTLHALIAGKDVALLKWAEKQHYNVTLNNDTAFLSLRPRLTRRKAPYKIYSVQHVIAVFSDRIKVILPNNQLNVAPIINHQTTKSANATINFAKISPAMLILVGKELNDLPLSITAIESKLDQGLLSGTVSLTMWGN